MNASHAGSGRLVPIYGFLAGDSLGLVVLVHEFDAVVTIGERLQEAASVRVARSRHFEVHHGGRMVDLHRTVADAGIAPLDRVDVVPKDE